jgi:osmotically-inducible protein OsmY
MSPKAVPYALAALLALPLAAGCDRIRPAPEAKSQADTEPGETPRALGLRVRLELLTELGVDGTRVTVNAKNGRIRLGGEVRKRATAEHAEQVARQVAGVTAVENRIRVAPARAGGASAEAGALAGELVAETERELADAALETRVRIALVDRLGSDGFRIGTEAASGVVTLAFPPKIQRARRREAVRIAEGVDGVERVVTLGKE